MFPSGENTVEKLMDKYIDDRSLRLLVRSGYTLTMSLSLGHRILFITLALTACVAASAISIAYVAERVVIGGSAYAQIRQRADVVADVAPPPLYLVESYLEVQRAAMNPDAATRQAAIARLKILHREWEDRMTLWSQNLPAGDLRQAVEATLIPARRFWVVVDQEFLPALAQGAEDRIGTLARGTLAEVFGQQQSAAVAATALGVRELDQAERQATEQLYETNLIGLILLGGTVGVVSVLMWRLHWAQARQLQGVVTAITAIKNGDLTTRVPVTTRDEVGALAQAVNHMADDLTTLVRVLREGSTALAQEAGKLAGSGRTVAVLAQGSRTAAEDVARQADAARVAVSSCLVGATAVGQTANGVSEDLHAIAVSLGEAERVSQTAAATIRQLEEAASSARSIVQGVSAIADRTRLLSLNAAIEAASAGAAGHGFAVVAGEVKSLSSESIKAAERAGTYLQSISTSAMTAAQAIVAAVQGLEGVHQRHAGIAASAEEQAASAIQVGGDLGAAVEQTTGIAQRMQLLVQGAATAATAIESITATGERMQALAEELEHLVATKRI